jgi:carbon starvation protein CstA
LIYCFGASVKQLLKESDALPVGYGAMLLEGLVAVLALGTVMMLQGSQDISFRNSQDGKQGLVDSFQL